MNRPTLLLNTLIGNPLDFTKPIDVTVYGFLIWFAQGCLWRVVQIGLIAAYLIQRIYSWLADSLGELVGATLELLAPLLLVVLLLAVIVHGMARTWSAFSHWQPVDLGQALLYGIIGLWFLGSAPLMIGLLEELRTGLVGEVRLVATEFFTFSLSEWVTGEGIPLGQPYDLDGQTGYSGFDIVATYAGISNVEQLFANELPPLLMGEYPFLPEEGCCFAYASNTALDGLDDAGRSEEIAHAQRGITLLLVASFSTSYALGEALVWFLYALATIATFLSMGIGFVFSAFQATAVFLQRSIQQYVNILIESMITAVFLALGHSFILSALYLSTLVLQVALWLGLLLVLWRCASAFKLLSQSLGGILAGASVGSAVKLDTAVQGGQQMAVGATMAAVGVATGATPLAMQGMQKMGQGMGTVTGSGQPSRLANAGLSMMSRQGMGAGGLAQSHERAGRSDATTAVYANTPQRDNPAKPDGGEWRENGRLRANIMEPATQSPTAQSPKAEQSDAPEQSVRPISNLQKRSDTKQSVLPDPIRQQIEQLGQVSHAQTAHNNNEPMLSPAMLAYDEQEIREALGAVWQTVKAYRAEGMPDVDMVMTFQKGSGLKQAIERLPVESPFQDTAQMTKLVQRVFEPITAKSKLKLDAPLASHLRRVEE